MESKVYFIGDDDHIKIGISESPNHRLSEMQIGNPSKLRIYCIIKGGAYLEKKLQDRFKKYKIRGEWFKLTGELKNFIFEEIKKQKYGTEDNINSEKKAKKIYLSDISLSYLNRYVQNHSKFIDNLIKKEFEEVE